jgi:hypothetical protein
MIGKREVILVLALVCISALCFVLIRVAKKNGNVAKVYVDGQLEKTLSLDREGSYTFGDGEFENVVTIEGGAVRMEAADCPDKLCVKMGEIYADGESITCLPHKVVIEVESDQQREYDIK